MSKLTWTLGRALFRHRFDCWQHERAVRRCDSQQRFDGCSLMMSGNIWIEFCYCRVPAPWLEQNLQRTRLSAALKQKGSPYRRGCVCKLTAEHFARCSSGRPIGIWVYPSKIPINKSVPTVWKRNHCTTTQSQKHAHTTNNLTYACIHKAIRTSLCRRCVVETTAILFVRLSRHKGEIINNQAQRTKQTNAHRIICATIHIHIYIYIIYIYIYIYIYI